MKAYVLRRNYVLERNLGDNSMFKVMERKMEVRKFERLHAKDGLFAGCVADNAFVRSLRLFTERVVLEDGASLESVTQSPGSICRSAAELGAPEEKEGDSRARKLPTTPSEMSAWFAAHVEFALEVREFRTLDVAIGSAMIVEVRRPETRPRFFFELLTESARAARALGLPRARSAAGASGTCTLSLAASS